MNSVLYHEQFPDVLVKGLDCHASEIESYAYDVVNEILENVDLSNDIEIVQIYMHGSRIFGNPRIDSDIDVVVFYKGDYKDYALFNILHDEDYENECYYEGFPIDFNPIQISEDEHEEIQQYIDEHDQLDEAIQIIAIDKKHILNEDATYALSDNGTLNQAFSYEIKPLNTNLSQRGNDIITVNRNADSFKFFVGSIVTGICPIDNKKHKGQITYLYYDGDDQKTPSYVFIQDKDDNRIIPLKAQTLTSFRTLCNDEPIHVVGNYTVQSMPMMETQSGFKFSKGQIKNSSNINFNDSKIKQVESLNTKKLNDNFKYFIKNKQWKNVINYYDNYGNVLEKYAVNHRKDLRLLITEIIEECGPCINLNWIDVSNIDTLAYAFYSAIDNTANLRYFNGDISEWDVSNVTDMSCMFNRSNFNGDISKWDVSNVTSMSSMFGGSKFNGDISNWDVSNVKSMQSMFSNSQFNRDISNWNVSNECFIAKMFKDCPIAYENMPLKCQEKLEDDNDQ